jgi:hypothetical protein
MTRYSWEKLFSFTVLILGAMYLIWAVSPIWEQQRLNDDSFITLTYAKNLVNGHGFVYNHPPATLGTTTPLFTLLTAALSLILPNVDVIKSAIIISTASWIGTGIILYLAAVHLGFRPLAGAVLAFVPLTIVNSTWLWFVGMEIWLFEFLLVLSFYFALTNRPLLAGLSVGLLFLTRGEGALVGGILITYFLISQKKLPKTLIIASVAVVGVWVIYAWFTFGTILPNTLSAKIAHREHLASFGREYGFLQAMTDILPAWFKEFNLISNIFSNIFLISFTLGLIGIVFDKQLRKWSFFLVWGAIYFIGYAIINPSTYHWYALHLFFVAEVMAGLGTAWVLNTSFRLSGFKRITVGALACLLVGLLLVPNILHGVKSAQSFRGDHRASSYIAVTEWLNENSHPEDTIAYLEIGYLGYYSENRIIDLAGLIDPLVAENIAEHGFTWGFWHYQPTYFLFNPGMDSESFLAEIRGAADLYHEVARFPRENDTPLVLFRREDETD